MFESYRAAIVNIGLRLKVGLFIIIDRGIHMIDAKFISNNVKHVVYAVVISILSFIPFKTYAAHVWYAGGGVGHTNYDNDGIETDLADRQVPGSSNLQDDKVPWYLFVGYRPTRYVGLEFGYQYLDRQEGTTELQSQPGVIANTSRETDGFMLSVHGRIPITSTISAQVMGGIYLWHLVTAVNSLSGGGAIAINFDDRSSDPFTGLGFEYALSENTAIHLNWMDFKIDNDHARVLNMGITYQFLVIE